MENGPSRDKRNVPLNLVVCFVKEHSEDTHPLSGYRYIHLNARATNLDVDRETCKESR